MIFQSAYGQLPDTDIWMFSIKKEKDQYFTEKGINITNRSGYDNQPSFTSNGKNFWYVSIGDDKQADIYLHDAGKNKNIPVTRTAESEYSPSVHDGMIASVVVEKDSAQRIWLYDEKTGTSKKVLFNEDSVGYYSFLNEDTVLYYKLTQPHSLRARSLSGGKDVWLADHPVRGFKSINRHEFIFGIKDSTSVVFYRYHSSLKKSVKYCSYPSLSEDIFWHVQLGLLKSENSQILRFDEAQQKWTQLFDFNSSGIKKITRFCLSNDLKKILIVSNL